MLDAPTFITAPLNPLPAVKLSSAKATGNGSNQNQNHKKPPMKNKAAQQLGRLGGRVTSEAKAKAAKENGKKGGRPKKNQTSSASSGLAPN